jgi:DNA-binding NarL/FixJ family response regulator
VISTHLGCDVVATAGQLDEAASLARSEPFDLAFLDLNMREVPPYPVARASRERGIPFASRARRRLP